MLTNNQLFMEGPLALAVSQYQHLKGPNSKDAMLCKLIISD